MLSPGSSFQCRAPVSARPYLSFVLLVWLSCSIRNALSTNAGYLVKRNSVFGLTPTGKLRIEMPIVPPFVKILRKEFKGAGGQNLMVTEGPLDSDFVQNLNRTQTPNTQRGQPGDLEQGFEYPNGDELMEYVDYYGVVEGANESTTTVPPTQVEQSLPESTILPNVTHPAEGIHDNEPSGTTGPEVDPDLVTTTESNIETQLHGEEYETSSKNEQNSNDKFTPILQNRTENSNGQDDISVQATTASYSEATTFPEYGAVEIPNDADTGAHDSAGAAIHDDGDMGAHDSAGAAIHDDGDIGAHDTASIAISKEEKIGANESVGAAIPNDGGIGAHDSTGASIPNDDITRTPPYETYLSSNDNIPAESDGQIPETPDAGTESDPNGDVEIISDEKLAHPDDESPTVPVDQSGTVSGDESPTVPVDQSERVSGDESPTVPIDQSGTVSGDGSPTVSGDESPTVSGDGSPTVSGDESPIVSGDQSPTVSDGHVSSIPSATELESKDETKGEDEPVLDETKTDDSSGNSRFPKLLFEPSSSNRTDMDLNAVQQNEEENSSSTTSVPALEEIPESNSSPAPTTSSPEVDPVSFEPTNNWSPEDRTLMDMWPKSTKSTPSIGGGLFVSILKMAREKTKIINDTFTQLASVLLGFPQAHTPKQPQHFH